MLWHGWTPHSQSVNLRDVPRLALVARWNDTVLEKYYLRVAAVGPPGGGKDFLLAGNLIRKNRKNGHDLANGMA